MTEARITLDAGTPRRAEQMADPTALIPLRYIGLGAHGPEDVVADDRGRILTGVADGRVLRVDGLTGTAPPRVEVLAETGGRPLGLELLPDGALLVCDAEQGLLRVDLTDGVVRILADTVAGERLRFASNVVALADGSVCFTVSSRSHPFDRWIGDLVEHGGTGRLLRLAPGAAAPEVLLDGLQFANGLAVSADGTFLIVAETGARRLTSYRLTGPGAGTAAPFVENLPGMPDNLWRAGPEGLVWVSLAGPRVPPLELLHRAPAGVRAAAARLAVHAPYRPSGTVGVLAVDDTGTVRHHLTRRRSGFRMVTAVCETGGHLVLGSLWERGIAVCEAPVGP